MPCSSLGQLRFISVSRQVDELCLPRGEPRGSCVDGPRDARDLMTLRQDGRVQSCVRPFDAVHMTAGLDEVRGLAPNQVIALLALEPQAGSADPRLDRFAITSPSPSHS